VLTILLAGDPAIKFTGQAFPVPRQEVTMLARSIITSLIAVLAFSLSSTHAWADEKKVAIDQLPESVVKAVKNRFPDAKMVSASTETEDGKTSFEIAVKNGEQNVEVLVTPQGTITEIEKQIDIKDCPKAVTEALEGKYPSAAYKMIEEVYKVEDGKENLKYYEILLVTAEKKKVEVAITAKGKIEKTEDKSKEKD
jgi:hypothetical protein